MFLLSIIRISSNCLEILKVFVINAFFLNLHKDNFSTQSVYFNCQSALKHKQTFYGQPVLHMPVLNRSLVSKFNILKGNSSSSLYS